MNLMKRFDHLCIRLYVWFQVRQFELDKMIQEALADKTKVRK